MGWTEEDLAGSLERAGVDDGVREAALALARGGHADEALPLLVRERLALVERSREVSERLMCLDRAIRWVARGDARGCDR